MLVVTFFWGRGKMEKRGKDATFFWFELFLPASFFRAEILRTKFSLKHISRSEAFRGASPLE